MRTTPHVLVIEDEPGIALALYKSLTKDGYRVDTAKSGTSGLRKAGLKTFDIILLDLGLPDMSGLHICRQLRSDGVRAPIIILTGENGVRTKVELLDAGATDYVTKPFSIDELQARIRACLRGNTETPTKQKLTVGQLTLSYEARTLERDGIIIPLRRKEFSLLDCLMKNAGNTVTRASLLQYAWEGSVDSWTNTVDVHIKLLRDKVDRPFAFPLIRTVHGVGYKLEVPKAVAEIL